MNQIRLYIPKVLLTFLLIFLLIGSMFSLLIQQKAFHKETFQNIIIQQDLGEKAYASLESYFQSRSNSSGIPAEVFMDSLDKDSLENAILYSTLQGLDYLQGNQEAYERTLQFTELETSVTDFFNQYADENGYLKDDAFQEKVQSTIDEAEKKIYFTTDTFKFSTLYENGWLAKIRHFLSLFQKMAVIIFILTGIILLLLILCCKSQFSESLYWVGLSGLFSGLLTSLPCLYVLKTDYFSGFVIKDPQIFAAVVGYLQFMTKQLCTLSICIGVVGLVCLIIFTIMQKISAKKNL